MIRPPPPLVHWSIGRDSITVKNQGTIGGDKKDDNRADQTNLNTIRGQSGHQIGPSWKFYKALVKCSLKYTAGRIA